MHESLLRVGASKVLLVSAIVVILLGATAFYLVAQPSSRSSSGTSSAQTVSSTIASGSISMASTSANSTSQGSSTSTSQSASTISPAPCARPYLVPANNVTTLSNGTQITESAEPVFVVGAGSTMDICILLVDQYVGSNFNYSSAPNLNATLWPGYTSYTTNDGNTIVVQYTPAINVTVTPPRDFSIDTNQSIVAEYEISTGENSTGFDGLGPTNWIPYSAFPCRSIPLAVGYSPSQVNNSDFPPYAGLPEGCFSPPLVGYIIGYTGASIGYLRSERTINLTENVTDISVSSSPTSGGQENITFRMHVQSFSYPVTLGSPAINSSVVRVFSGNPELVTPANNYCSWIADNQTAWSDQKITTLNEVPTGYLQFDSPTLQMSPYSSINYGFSILISGPIATDTAIDGVIILGNIVVGASDFPVSIAGQLQTISGSCDSLLS